MYWLGLVIGFLSGGFIGVSIMCLLQVNRCKKCSYNINNYTDSDFEAMLYGTSSGVYD